MNRQSAPPFLNGWFAVSWSHRLRRGQVVPIKSFGRELVLYRDRDGCAHVLDARCPHLGAHLGHGGRVTTEGHLACPFHGWEFDATGSCANIPYARKIPARAKIHGWPVKEVNGFILAYYHNEGKAPDFDVPDLGIIGDRRWSCHGRREWIIKTQQVEIMENAVDRAHFLYVHNYAEMPEVTHEAEGHRFRAVAKAKNIILGRRIDSVLDITLHGPGCGDVRLQAGPKVCILSSTTPIDETTVIHRMAFMVDRSVNILTRHVVARAVIHRAAQEFTNDIPIWENKSFIARPVLCDGDGPIMKLRKWYKRYLPAQEGRETENGKTDTMDRTEKALERSAPVTPHRASAGAPGGLKPAFSP